MQQLVIEKERKLRHIEEDFNMKTEELRQEMDRKNHMLDSEQERQARAIVEK